MVTLLCFTTLRTYKRGVVSHIAIINKQEKEVPIWNGRVIHLTKLITSPINIMLYFGNGQSNQHEIFTIAKSFTETNNHAKMIEK